MADRDNTTAGTSGSRRPDEGSADGSPLPTASPDIPQRHHLPMRKAATMPDVSQRRGDGTSDPDLSTAGAASSSLPSRDRDVEGDGTREHDGVARGADAASGPSDVDGVHSGGGAAAAGVAASSTSRDAGPEREASTDGSSTDGSSTAEPSTAQQSAAEPSKADPSTTELSTDGPSSGAPSTAEPSTADPSTGGRSADSRSADGPSPDGPSPNGTSTTEPSPAEPSIDTAALSVRPPEREAARRAAVRDNAATAKPALARFLQVVVALFFPVIVVGAAVRAVATSSFLWLEYNRPGFPADQYGFSLDDRMTYGSYALDYVLNFAPARYLGDLRTPEGEPLFLESEVGHMADVKGVLGLSFFIALVLFVLAVLACVYLARRYKGGVRRALFAGAVFTLAAAVVLTVLAILAWQTFFTQVHALFFADGTWTFRVDDTLIRLFPEQFWTDSAVTVAVLVLGATIVTLVATWPTKARRERSRLAQEETQLRYREALEAS